MKFSPGFRVLPIALLCIAGCCKSHGGAASRPSTSTASETPAEPDTTVLIGKPAPPIQLKTLAGQTVSLEQMKGQVVLLDFWAVWCLPCRKGLPHLNQLAADPNLQKQGLKVWAINSGEEPERVEGYLSSKELKAMTVVLDEKQDLSTPYYIQGLPTTVVVDRNGIISAALVGLAPQEDINKAVEKALKQK